jgi:predicted enzyme involved in methoxymalonyl-ACP biosynthesis
MAIPENYSTQKAAPLDMRKWQVIISDWESSKENQKEYCERLGINLNTFTYARSKLMKTKKTKSTFIPLTVSHTETQNSSVADTVVIETPQGFKLHVSSALSLDRLSKIFKLCGWLNAEVTR